MIRKGIKVIHHNYKVKKRHRVILIGKKKKGAFDNI